MVPSSNVGDIIISTGGRTVGLFNGQGLANMSRPVGSFDVPIVLSSNNPVSVEVEGLSASNATVILMGVVVQPKSRGLVK